MGASHSGYQTVGDIPSSRFQTDPIPYTSYSVDRLDGQRGSPQQRFLSVAQGKSSSPRHEPHSTGPIVVVADGTMVQSMEDTMQMELQKLRDIPTFLPILKGQSNISQVEDSTLIEKMDYKHLLLLCTRYQQHLKQCAEAVTFDQNSLTSRIKEIDVIITGIMTSLLERRRRFDKHSEQIQKITDMSMMLSRIQQSVDDLLPLMDRINSVLPTDEQLEPFSMKVSGPR